MRCPAGKTKTNTRAVWRPIGRSSGLVGYAALAQLVEHRIRNAGVRCSSHLGSTITINNLSVKILPEDARLAAQVPNRHQRERTTAVSILDKRNAAYHTIAPSDRRLVTRVAALTKDGFGTYFPAHMTRSAVQILATPVGLQMPSALNLFTVDRPPPSGPSRLSVHHHL